MGVNLILQGQCWYRDAWRAVGERNTNRGSEEAGGAQP